MLRLGNNLQLNPENIRQASTPFPEMNLFLMKKAETDGDAAKMDRLESQMSESRFSRSIDAIDRDMLREFWETSRLKNRHRQCQPAFEESGYIHVKTVIRQHRAECENWG
jgi:hypothetical protein